MTFPISQQVFDSHPDLTALVAAVDDGGSSENVNTDVANVGVFNLDSSTALGAGLTVVTSYKVK